MRASQHSAEQAFWEAIDDGPTEGEQALAEWRDDHGDAERQWKE